MIALLASILIASSQEEAAVKERMAEKIGFQLFRVPTGSMHPTLKIGEWCSVDRRAYKKSPPKRGDTVFFHPPKYALPPVQRQGEWRYRLLVSRCVAVPGDRVEFRDNRLLINGRKVSEPYAGFYRLKSQNEFVTMDPREVSTRAFKLVRFRGAIWPVQVDAYGINALPGIVSDRFAIEDQTAGEKLRRLPATKLPPGYILTMGDNRNNAFDGRCWGPLPITNVVGKLYKKLD